MNDNTNSNSGSMICALTCWGIGAFTGLLAMVGLMLMGGWMFMQGAFVAAVVFVAVGGLLSLLLCRALPPIQQAGSAPTQPRTQAKPAKAAAAPTPKAAAKPAPAPAAEAAPKPAAKAKPAAAPASASTQLSGEQELAARKGAWRYEADSAGSAKPSTLMAARDGKSDDLKLLKGVGPKLEETLNGLGFYHFDQIADWTAEQVAWVDEQLKFKGRIDRDGWIDQAKILAAGGETEFSKRNK